MAAADDRITISDGICTIKLVGEIDFSNAGIISDWIMKAIDESGVDRVELDFSSMTFLDSTGIGTLISASRHAAGRNMRLSAKNAKPHIRRLLEVAGVDGVIGLS